MSSRLGIGVQVSNFTSTMATDGSNVAGPGDGFEVDGFLVVGLGFDTRLGKHWSLGVGAAFAAGLKTEMRSLEGGINAGYRWNATP